MINPYGTNLWSPQWSVVYALSWLFAARMTWWHWRRVQWAVECRFVRVTVANQVDSLHWVVVVVGWWLTGRVSVAFGRVYILLFQIDTRFTLFLTGIVSSASLFTDRRRSLLVSPLTTPRSAIFSNSGILSSGVSSFMVLAVVPISRSLVACSLNAPMSTVRRRTLRKRCLSIFQFCSKCDQCIGKWTKKKRREISHHAHCDGFMISSHLSQCQHDDKRPKNDTTLFLCTQQILERSLE